MIRGREIGKGGKVAEILPATVTFLSSAVDTANLTTYTFSDISIGDATATRRILAAIEMRIISGTPTFGAVTIGGVAATLVSSISGATGRIIGLFIAHVPTGTTATVVAPLATGGANCAGLAMWALDNLISDIPVDTSVVTVISGTVSYPVLTTFPDGVAIFANIGTSALSTFTWAGATERFDETIEGTASHTGADALTDGSDISAVITASNASTLSTAVCASFR